MSLLAHSHRGGERHCQILQRKNPHPHHPPRRKDQTIAEMSATHSTGCGTTNVTVSLPETQRKVPNRDGQDIQAKAIPGSPWPRLVMLWRAEEGTSRAEQAEVRDTLCCPSLGHVHSNSVQFT